MKAPNGVVLPPTRARAPSRMSSSEPTTNVPAASQKNRSFPWSSNGTKTAAARQSETPVAVRTFGVMPVRARLVTERLASERAPLV